MLNEVNTLSAAECDKLDFGCAACAFNKYLSGDFAWIIVKADFTVWWVSPTAEALLQTSIQDAIGADLFRTLGMAPQSVSSIGLISPLTIHSRSGLALALVALPLRDSGGHSIAHLVQISKAPPEALHHSVLLLTSRSSAMRAVIERAERVAQYDDVNVLIMGETGAGKSELAKLIHACSPRASGPFQVLNCAGFSDELFNTELFGYEKGAYTGAFETKVGLLELADHGTVFLDDVNTLHPLAQAKLLEFLDTRSIRRTGGRRAIPLNVRVVSATNESIEKKIVDGSFREDLFFRLNGFGLDVPPLRQRKEDIEYIVLHTISTRFLYPKTFDAQAMQVLNAQPWKGNVRELIHAVETAYIESANSPRIEAKHLAAIVTGRAQDEPPANGFAGRVSGAPTKEQVLACLEDTRYRRGKAADRLGISRATLWRLMREWSIT